jgi:acetolactate synthase-1/3 small subunit
VSSVNSRFHTIVVRVENKPGVLARVAGLFARRGFNIESLAVAPTDDERFSRITFVVDGEAVVMEQVIKQLDKLINVVEITELVTVVAPPDRRAEIMDLVRIFEARVLNVGHDRLMVSLAGSPSRVDDFEDLLRPYGIVEVQRTGRVALPRLEKAPAEA